jgi:hypothetical protein
MIEGNIFLKDNHQVLNWSGRIVFGVRPWRNPQQEHKRREDARQQFLCKSPLPHVFISPLFKIPATNSEAKF